MGFKFHGLFEISVAFLLLLGCSVSGLTEEKAMHELKSNKSLEETIEHLTWQTGTYSQIVVGAVKYNDLLFRRDKNYMLPQVASIQLMNRKWFERLLENDVAATLWIPVRIMIRSEKNGIFVSWMSLQKMAKLSGLKNKNTLLLFEEIDSDILKMMQSVVR